VWPGAATLRGMTGERGYPEQDTIDLQDFLKMRGMVETGGEAKFRVQGGEVRLNGEIETRRRKKLRRGDIVEYAGERVRVDF
jgi:ribosome-associated protein